MVDYNNYLIWDCENNNRKLYGCDAGCFKYDELVAIGLKNRQELVTKYIYPDNIKEFKIDESVLVGHNIAHDLLFVWHLQDLQDFFLRGGRIWDTQYAHYCLTGQQERYPALRDIAVRVHGCLTRDKVMEPYWKDGIMTSDIPKELVLLDVGNDCLDTEQVYLQQVKKAQELGMLNLLEMEMDSILATTEMRYNGMLIDKERMQRNRQVLDDKLKELYKEMNIIVQRYWK